MGLGLARLVASVRSAITSATASVAAGATVARGTVPAGATATCKKNGSVLGAATVTAQGAASYTLGAAGPLVAGDQVSFPWTLTGETPAAVASSGSPQPLTISGSPANGTVGTAYIFFPTVAGGSGTKTFNLTGSLPAGLSFSSSNGAISGTPSAAGTASGLSIVVSDITGSATLSGLSIVVSAAGSALSISGTPPSGTVGTAYTWIPAISGGTPPYTLSGGTLPSGTSYTSQGTSSPKLTGTPTAAQTINGQTVTVTDSVGAIATIANRNFVIAAANTVTLISLFPNIPAAANNFSATPADASGTKVMKVFRRTAGSTLAITPNDGKFAISDDGTNAYVVVGGTPPVSGDVGTQPTYTVTETHPQGTNSPLNNTLPINIVAVSNAASMRAAGYRAWGSGGQVNNSTLSIQSNRSRFKGWKRYILARGTTADSLSFGWSNWRIAPTTTQGELSLLSPLVISAASWWIPGAPTPIVPMTWGGSRSHTFAAGVDLDCCDPIAPSAFGLASFDDALEVRCRLYGDMGANGVYIAGSTFSGAGQVLVYDPANEPAGSGAAPSDIDTDAVFAQPTGAQQFNIPLPNLLLGRPASGKSAPHSVFYLSDSIGDRLGDLGGDGQQGGGYQRRAAFAAGVPYFSHAVGGRSAYNWVENNKNGRVILSFFDTLADFESDNDIHNGRSLAQIQSDKNEIATQARAIGVTKVIHGTQVPRCGDGTSANGGNNRTTYRATDLTNQFPAYSGAPNGLGWEVGGTKDQFNAWLKTRSDAAKADFLVDVASIVTDPNTSSKWKVQPFTALLTSAVAVGATSIVMDTAPAIGTCFVIDAGTSGIDPIADPTNGGNNQAFQAITVTGSGPYTVGLQIAASYPGQLANGATPLTTHAVGAQVRGTSTADEVHPTGEMHVAIVPLLTSVLFSLTPAYTFTNTEAQSYVSRMTAPPGDTRRSLIDTLFGSLKSSGVYSKLDAIWLPAAHDAQAATLNLKGASYTLTPSGTTVPAWAPNKGYTGNGSTGYVATNFNPTTLAGSVGFVQDSAHIGAWVLTDSASTAFDVGSANGRARLHAGAGTGTTGRIGTNSGAVAAATGTASPPRHIVETRTATAVAAQYVNGAQDGTSTTASNGLATGIDLLREGGGTSFSDRQVAVAHLGSALATADATALYNATRAYLQGVGVAA